VSLDPEVGMILADFDRVQQIGWNLLSNAIKFTPTGGTVSLRVEHSQSTVLIEVTDTGRGIKADFLPHLWQRFRQADSSTTRVHGGLGLGLAIVRHLAEAHGGSVAASSPGENCGATFIVELPIVAADKEPLETPHPGDHHVQPSRDNILAPEAPPRLDGLRVLVVDDDADTCDLLTAILQKAGAKVLAARSANEALGFISTFQPDVLVSDIGMPEIDGYGLLRRVRALPAEQHGRVPAVALTAYAKAADRVKALRSGFQIHVPKPVSMDELIAAVANASGRIEEPELTR
jgi:CheY-like chemotaxis protein